MKKVFIILLTLLFLYSCSDNINVKKVNNLSWGVKSEKLKDLPSSPNWWWGNLKSLNNDDSFKN